MMGGFDYFTLVFKAKFMAIQLGIYMLDEYYENLRLLGINPLLSTDAVANIKKTNNLEKRIDMPVKVRFCCYYGLQLDPLNVLVDIPSDEVVYRANILGLDLDEVRDAFEDQ